MRKTKKKIENLRDAMSVPGPVPGSSTNSIHYAVAGVKNLFLVVYANGARGFMFDRTFEGRRYTLILGALGEMSLSDGVEAALSCHRLVEQGVDLKAHRKMKRHLTFGQFVQKFYLGHIENSKTYKNMLNMLKKRLLPTFGNMPLNQISRPHVRTFLDDLASERKPQTGKQLSGGTVNRHHSFLSRMFKFIQEMNLITDNPCAGLRRARENPSRARVFQDDETQRLFGVMQPKLHRQTVRAIYLLLTLGLRTGEVLKLAWSDVDFRAGTIFIRKGKNGESRYVGLNSLALDLLQTMFAERDAESNWVFPSKSKSGHLQGVKGMFKSLCREAGIEGVVPHDCRRSHATRLHRAGLDAVTIKEVLGHRSLQSTMVYIRVASARVAEANELAATKLREVINGPA